MLRGRNRESCVLTARSVRVRWFRYPQRQPPGDLVPRRSPRRVPAGPTDPSNLSLHSRAASRLHASLKQRRRVPASKLGSAGGQHAHRLAVGLGHALCDCPHLGGHHGIGELVAHPDTDAAGRTIVPTVTAIRIASGSLNAATCAEPRREDRHPSTTYRAHPALRNSRCITRARSSPAVGAASRTSGSSLECPSRAGSHRRAFRSQRAGDRRRPERPSEHEQAGDGRINRTSQATARSRTTASRRRTPLAPATPSSP